MVRILDIMMHTWESTHSYASLRRLLELRRSNGYRFKEPTPGPVTQQWISGNFEFSENASFWWRTVCSKVFLDHLETSNAKKDLRNAFFSKF